jgi:4-amino-4-deoxy-L-arabinose transferase-like glycosyltransferase
MKSLLGGSGPASWQRAALVLCTACAIIMVIPIYLLSLELFDEQTAWLACIFAISNPVIGYIVVNVLSESTFLLWWSFGLWLTVRFLREWRFRWLPLAIAFGALAYLTRPEGLLLPAALAATMLILPLAHASRIKGRERWRVIAFLCAGLLLLAGPYVVKKGSLGTKPGIARVLGLAARSEPLALEREKPLPPGQTTAETYWIATVRMFKTFRAAVTPALFPFALLGLVLAGNRADRARASLFLGIVLIASAVALVRLHATAGYCTVRHGLVPGLILTQCAAYGLTWLISKALAAGRSLSQLRAGVPMSAPGWTLVIALVFVTFNFHSLGTRNAGPFSVYEKTGRWLAVNTRASDQVLDMTDWSLFFSGRRGYRFAEVYEAPTDPKTRWIVARQPHVEGHNHYSVVVREMIGGRRPVAVIPGQAHSKEIQIRIYDRQDPVTGESLATDARDANSTRR